MSCRTYPCNICGRVLKQLTHWRDHQATHSSVRNYKCSVCTSTFKTRGAMRFHFRKNHTLQQFYTCISSMENEPPARRGKSLRPLQKSIQTLRTSSSIRPMVSSKGKKRPQQKKPPPPTVSMNSNNRPMQCTICHIVIRHGRNFKKHVMRHSNSDEVCPHKSCGLRFVWKKALKQHLRDHHNGVTVKGNERPVRAVTKLSKSVKEVDEDASWDGIDDEELSLLDKRPETPEKDKKLKISSSYTLTGGVKSEEKKKSYRYECGECAIGFDDNDALWKHLYERHLNKEKSNDTKKKQPVGGPKSRKTR